MSLVIETITQALYGAFITMKIINLLPNPLSVLTSHGTLLLARPLTLEAVSAERALVPFNAEDDPTGFTGAFDIHYPQLTIENLPPESPETILIVPQSISEALDDRTDLLYPVQHPHVEGHVLLVHGASLAFVNNNELLASEIEADDAAWAASLDDDDDEDDYDEEDDEDDYDEDDDEDDEDDEDDDIVGQPIQSFPGMTPGNCKY